MTASRERDSTARDRLLSAAMAHARAHGTADTSLREWARAVGTSHRMLIYHFGSKEGLLVAIVQATEAEQRRFLTDLADTGDVDPSDSIRAMWHRLTDPALEPNERLFFELYGQALQGRAGTVGLLDDIVESWLAPGAEYAQRYGIPAATARADARLGLAVIRGLLLDLLATGDRAGVGDAVEHYIALREAAAPG